MSDRKEPTPPTDQRKPDPPPPVREHFMPLCRTFEDNLFRLFTCHGPSEGLLFSRRQRVVDAMLDAMNREIEKVTR